MKKNCRHYFVIVNAIVLVTLSAISLYWGLIIRHEFNIKMIIAVVVNGSLLWGISERKAIFVWPWLIYYCFLIVIFTILAIYGISSLRFGDDGKFVVIAAIYMYFICLIIAVVFEYIAIRKCNNEGLQEASHIDKSDVNVEVAANV